MASPRPTSCAPRNPVTWPWPSTDPDSRDTSFIAVSPCQQRTQSQQRQFVQHKPGSVGTAANLPIAASASAMSASVPRRSSDSTNTLTAGPRVIASPEANRNSTVSRPNAMAPSRSPSLALSFAVSVMTNRIDHRELPCRSEKVALRASSSRPAARRRRVGWQGRCRESVAPRPLQNRHRRTRPFPVLRRSLDRRSRLAGIPRCEPQERTCIRLRQRRWSYPAQTEPSQWRVEIVQKTRQSKAKSRAAAHCQRESQR